MVMGDSTGSDHSPPLSDKAGSSWTHWEHEIGSLSGINLNSGSGLSGLVEDKEIAARAVAFVVNSTRKGIVPLCADIANLLRAKRSLEKKVFLLKRENEALRGSTATSFRTSHSTSPTPPIYSDRPLLHDHASSVQERSRPCSRCSQCSSTISSSPKLDVAFSFKGYLPSPTHPRAVHRSPRSPRHRPPNGLTTAVTTQAVVHCLADTDLQDSGCDISREGQGSTRSEGQRKNSLPEIISVPDVKVLKVSPKICKQTQCSLFPHSESSLEEQFVETVRLNSKLAEELGSSRKEIEILKGRLKELEMNQLARECWREQFQVEIDGEESASDDRPLTSTESPYNFIVKKHYSLNGSSRSRLQCQFAPAPSSVVYAEPLYGCKCRACEEAVGGEAHAALPHTLSQELPKFPINSKLQVQLGDHVVIKGERTGRIRYIGHLDKIGEANMVFVGLELDAPVGRHDGFFNGKRYFFCSKDHGIIIPLHDIVCKVQPKKSARMEDGGKGGGGGSNSSHHSSRSDNSHHHPYHHRYPHHHQHLSHPPAHGLHHSQSFKLTSLKGSSSPGSRDSVAQSLLTLSQTSLRTPKTAWSTSTSRCRENSSTLSLPRSEDEGKGSRGEKKQQQHHHQQQQQSPGAIVDDDEDNVASRVKEEEEGAEAEVREAVGREDRGKARPADEAEPTRRADETELEARCPRERGQDSPERSSSEQEGADRAATDDPVNNDLTATEMKREAVSQGSQLEGTGGKEAKTVSAKRSEIWRRIEQVGWPPKPAEKTKVTTKLGKQGKLSSVAL